MIARQATALSGGRRRHSCQSWWLAVAGRAPEIPCSVIGINRFMAQPRLRLGPARRSERACSDVAIAIRGCASERFRESGRCASADRTVTLAVAWLASARIKAHTRASCNFNAAARRGADRAGSPRRRPARQSRDDILTARECRESAHQGARASTARRDLILRSSGSACIGPCGRTDTAMRWS
jgi:hypothetical protein